MSCGYSTRYKLKHIVISNNIFLEFIFYFYCFHSSVFFLSLSRQGCLGLIFLCSSSHSISAAHIDCSVVWRFCYLCVYANVGTGAVDYLIWIHGIGAGLHSVRDIRVVVLWLFAALSHERQTFHRVERWRWSWMSCWLSLGKIKQVIRWQWAVSVCVKKEKCGFVIQGKKKTPERRKEWKKAANDLGNLSSAIFRYVTFVNETIKVMDDEGNANGRIKLAHPVGVNSTVPKAWAKSWQSECECVYAKGYFCVLYNNGIQLRFTVVWLSENLRTPKAAEMNLIVPRSEIFSINHSGGWITSPLKRSVGKNNANNSSQNKRPEYIMRKISQIYRK